MAAKKRKPTAPPAATAEAEAPAEGTKGIIWGQQVKKVKRRGWAEELDWKNASPANFDEFLMGAEEGGFMGLEELDGDAFDNVVGAPPTGQEKEGKKRKTGQLNAAEGGVTQPKETAGGKVGKKGKGAEGKGAAETSKMVAEKAPAEEKPKLAGPAGKATQKGSVNEGADKGQQASKVKSTIEAVPKGLSKRQQQQKAEKAKDGVSDAVQQPKARKMTSSEKKKRKREKRRERQEQARSQKLDPGLFMGVKTAACDGGLDEVGGVESLEGNAEAAGKSEGNSVPGGELGLDGGVGEKKLSKKERRRLRREAKRSEGASSPVGQNVSLKESNGGLDGGKGSMEGQAGTKLTTKSGKGNILESGREVANGLRTWKDSGAFKQLKRHPKKKDVVDGDGQEGLKQDEGLSDSDMGVDPDADVGLDGDVTSDGDVKSDGGADLDGDASLDGGVNVDSDLDPDGDADLEDDAIPDGDEESDGDANLDEGEEIESDAEAEQERRGSGPDAGASECDVSAWEVFGLHPLLLKGLSKLGFSQPTEIQRQCIPAALKQGKDLIGAAETGSGKTLAFGLPILNRLLQIEEKEKKQAEKGRAPLSGDGVAVGKKGGSPLRALIMTPTRELALQVCSHLKAAAQETSIIIVPIVGGMAVPKQQRLLRSRPAVIVGTPGRLWELISQGEQHLLQVGDLRFFVLDEADRMVEKGHFQELQSIIDSLPKQGGGSPAETDPLDEETPAEGIPTVKHAAQRQTFVFSATLMVPPSLKRKLKGAGKSPIRREESQVAALIKRAGLSRHAAIVNLTSDVMVASKLEEAVIECMDTEKDAYLYYLLKMHPSRTIVFCTAISALRRIAALLQLLQVPSWALHAQLQQRQRFKAMDRFKKEPHGVLVATDVAARGLDIEGIRCVIHYQLPLSTEIYVHRSGRTARAASDGISVALVSPSERPKLNALCKALGREGGLADFPVDQSYMPAVLERVKLALKVDGALRQQQQVKAKRSWLEKHADELGIELDADELEEQSRTSKKGKVRIDGDKALAPADAKAIEAKLRNLVKQPLQPRAMHHTYLAGSGISAETVKQLQQAVHRRGGVKSGAIGTSGEEALDALRNKRAKR